MRHLALLALGLSLAACSADPPPAPDAASRDAGAATDAVEVDAGAADALEPDLGFPDAAPGDADALAAEDAPAPDADPPDLGPPDTGLPPPFGPVNVDLAATRPPPYLSGFNLVRWSEGRLEYNQDVTPYTLAMPLFSDFALKERAFWLPPGTQIAYHGQDAFEFPVGTAIVKSFIFPEDLRAPAQNQRLIETRVLIRYATGWRAYPYVWRADRSDADYRPSGTSLTIAFKDPDGVDRTARYLVPQRNQCLQCHQLRDPVTGLYTTIIGPKARHLNHDITRGGVTVNQLQDLSDRGLLSGMPALATIPRDFEQAVLETTSTTALSGAELTRAARDYLDINCAHCHTRGATQGVTSQLFLDVFETDPFHLGVCKEPGSAGRGTGGFRFDVVPGNPDESIMYYRVQTATVGDMMPLIGRSLRHDLGARLVRAWIAAMPPDTCQ